MYVYMLTECAAWSIELAGHPDTICIAEMVRTTLAAGSSTAVWSTPDSSTVLHGHKQFKGGLGALAKPKTQV